jgi:hypothetical protein
MAEDLARIVPDEDPPATAGAEASPAGEGDAPYQSRFQLLFGVLLGVGLAAIVATFLVLASGKKAEDPNAVSWADWHPSASDGLEAVSQIADHVGQRYTLPSGNQLVGVRGGPLELANLPVTIAVEQQGNVKIIDKKGVLYNLCGLGKNCSITEGKPTVARSLVLRREALELSLYTFRYVKNIDQVVVILPPRKGQKPTFAMFFRRGDVGASLNRPLAATLPGSPPIPPDVSKGEQAFIDSLTSANLFSYAPQQGGDAHIYLVLSPPTG